MEIVKKLHDLGVFTQEDLFCLTLSVIQSSEKIRNQYRDFINSLFQLDNDHKNEFKESLRFSEFISRVSMFPDNQSIISDYFTICEKLINKQSMDHLLKFSPEMYEKLKKMIE